MDPSPRPGRRGPRHRSTHRGFRVDPRLHRSSPSWSVATPVGCPRPDLTHDPSDADHLSMDVALPRTLEEALELAASNPEVVPIAGGTDVMVELNMDLGRPETLMDVSRLTELGELRRENGHLFLGAGVTYTRSMRELPGHTALVQASRSVGSPQIRNRGTVGGNLGTGSPAGDARPGLLLEDRHPERHGDRGREPVPAGRRRITFDPDGARVRRADGRAGGGR